jgi:16S rRNA (uracil1498-N3)-methyltransferase
MNLFYTKNIKEGLAQLSAEEARHCIQVLRHRVGDVLDFTDGEGKWYSGKIIEAGKKSCTIGINTVREIPKKHDYQLHIGIAPTKNIARLEWFLEKATEIGIDRISLFLSEHSERRKVRMDRLEKVILSAMKQSLKTYLPKLDTQLFTFHELMSLPKYDHKYMAYLGDGVNYHLWENYPSGEDVCIIIGPEGGFSPTEASIAKSNSFQPVRLGENRLRTETAALLACQTIYLINQLNR